MQRGQAIFRNLFVPSLLAISGVAWVYRPATEAFLAQARWGIDFTTAALLATLLLIWLGEQAYPARPEWNYNVAANPVRGINRFGRDLFYLTFITLLNGLATGFLATRVAAALAGRGFGFDRVGALWPRNIPFALKVILAFLTVELFSYGYHRAAHRFDVLWRFHSTHHVITEITGMKALRTHPIDNALFYLPRTVPLMLLGAGAEEMVAATYFGCMLGILSHANIDLSERGVGWFINLPSFHAVHHSSDVEESRSNYGCHTVFWDRVFGTFRPTSKGFEVGVTPVGTRTLWQELVGPLYRSKM